MGPEAKKKINLSLYTNILLKVSDRYFFKKL